MTKPKRSRSTNGELTHRRKTGAREVHPGTRRWIAGALIGAAVIAAGAFVAWRIHVSRSTPTSPSGDAAGPAAPKPTAAARRADWQALVGRWVRTDTPYVIEIRSIQESGRMEAAYYNPQREIHVARAEAREKDGALAIYVELRDVNYPGSNYTLVYNRENDLLLGVYFQAVQRQRYNVAFARQPPSR